MRKFSLAPLLALSVLVAGEPSGIQPRVSRSQYEVTCFTESLAVAATLLSHDQVSRLFGAKLDRDYVVVEVGFYSKSRSAFDVRQSDFKLRLKPSGAVIPAADPRSIGDLESRKALPDVATSRAVAGYLFFPIEANLGRAGYELDYKGNGAWLTLPIRSIYR